MTDVSIPMRPRTANPKLESLNLAENALLHSSHPSFNVPSPPATQRGAGGFGEGSVIWSQDTVPLEELSRPHTSNPRYVEMTTQKLETPRRSSPQQRHDTPSRTSQADTTSAVLWASDAQDISPAMLARPLTSNPWLTRFLDGVPADIKSDNPDATGRRSGAGEILWSDKEIEDWRLLARPHASNPVYEASVAASRNVVKPVTDVSGVLWSSEDLSSDEVFQLRAVVESQQQRIKELEAHVAMLQEQMRAFATNAGMTPLVQSVEVLRLSGVHDTLSPAVEGVVGARQAATTHATRPGTAASGRRDVASHESTPLDNLTPVRPTPTRHTAVPTARTPPHTDEHSSPSQAPYARASTSLGYRPGEGHDNDDDDDEGNAADEVIQPGSPTEPTAAVPAPLPAATPAREVEFIVEDDNADVDDSVFSKVASSNAPSRFASKLRDTTGQSRPDTAGTRRGAPFEGAVAPPRPSSAPAARAAKRFDAVPASFPLLVSEALVAEASIGAAYDALRLPGCAFVSKESFRRMYMARAAEFGTPCTKTTLDRLLRPYRSKGDDVLSLEEFAVLYLQLQRW